MVHEAHDYSIDPATAVLRRSGSCAIEQTHCNRCSNRLYSEQVSSKDHGSRGYRKIPEVTPVPGVLDVLGGATAISGVNFMQISSL